MRYVSIKKTMQWYFFKSDDDTKNLKANGPYFKAMSTIWLDAAASSISI